MRLALSRTGAAREIAVALLAAAGVVGVSVLVLVAIVAVALRSPYSDEPGAALAARLGAAHDPLIQAVEFRPATMIDPPEVHVIVRAGVTENQTEQLWCSVVAPAGGSQFEGELGALIYDQQGNWLASNVTC